MEVPKSLIGKLKYLIDRNANIVNINMVISKIIETKLIKNDTWGDDGSSKFQHEHFLAIADCDLEKMPQFKIMNGVSYYYFSISRLFLQKRVTGHKVTYVGNGNEIQKRHHNCFFDYENKVISDLDYCVFYDFIKLFSSKKKVIITSNGWALGTKVV